MVIEYVFAGATLVVKVKLSFLKSEEILGDTFQIFDCITPIEQSITSFGITNGEVRTTLNAEPSLETFVAPDAVLELKM